MSHTDSNQEIEIKLRVSDAASAHELIRSAGFQIAVPRTFEENTIYDTPEGTLGGRGTVLRLRRAGEKYTLTVKGKALDGKYKSRTEDEVMVSDYEAARRILDQLGYHKIFRYEKYRTEYFGTTESGTVTLDETPIGTFLELEGDPGWIDRTARTLQFTESDYVIESYGRLYLNYCMRKGIEPNDMVLEN